MLTVLLRFPQADASSADVWDKTARYEPRVRLALALEAYDLALIREYERHSVLQPKNINTFM